MQESVKTGACYGSHPRCATAAVTLPLSGLLCTRRRQRSSRGCDEFAPGQGAAAAEAAATDTQPSAASSTATSTIPGTTAAILHYTSSAPLTGLLSPTATTITATTTISAPLGQHSPSAAATSQECIGSFNRLLPYPITTSTTLSVPIGSRPSYFYAPLRSYPMVPMFPMFWYGWQGQVAGGAPSESWQPPHVHHPPGMFQAATPTPPVPVSDR